jgi:hypothetical protein
MAIMRVQLWRKYFNGIHNLGSLNEDICNPPVLVPPAPVVIDSTLAGLLGTRALAVGHRAFDVEMIPFWEFEGGK